MAQKNGFGEKNRYPYICYMKIGKINKRMIIIANRKASRELEIENSIGWKSSHKVHKTMKDYKRNPKHKKGYLSE